MEVPGKSPGSRTQSKSPNRRLSNSLHHRHLSLSKSQHWFLRLLAVSATCETNPTSELLYRKILISFCLLHFCFRKTKRFLPFLPSPFRFSVPSFYPFWILLQLVCWISGRASYLHDFHLPPDLRHVPWFSSNGVCINYFTVKLLILLANNCKIYLF